MSLRDKTLLTVGLTILVVITVIYAISQIVLLESFTRLEEQYTLQRVQRAVQVINSRLAALSLLADHWASHEQVYNLAQNSGSSNPDNVLDENLQSTGLDLILIFNTSNQLVYQRAFDFASGEASGVTDNVINNLGDSRLLLEGASPSSSHNGIFIDAERPLLVVTRTVLDLGTENSILGTLVLGQYLSEEQLGIVSDITNAEVNLYQVGSPQMPAYAPDILPILQTDTPTVVRPASEQVIGGYTLLNDIYGEPAVLLSVHSARMIYQQGRDSLSYFVFLLFSVGGVFTLITVLLLERQILSRMANLSKRVIAIGERGNLSERVGMDGNDELSNLAGAIDNMLDRLQQASRALQESEEKFRTMAETSAAIIFIYQYDRFRYINRIASNILGYDRQQLEGMSYKDLLAPEMLEDVESYVNLFEHGKYFYARLEVKVIAADGRQHWLEFTASPIEFEGAPAIIGTAYDITERKLAEHQLRYMSAHDVLSDLYNRAFFEEELARLEKGRNLPISIVVIDIDGLKPTNDTCGHAAGDELIRRTAEVLRTIFRAEDVIARIGGDEFAVILPGVDAEEAERTKVRIREVLAWHNEQYPDLPLRFSVGIATGIAPGSMVAVMRQADEQMYKEKVMNRMHPSEPSSCA